MKSAYAHYLRSSRFRWTLVILVSLTIFYVLYIFKAFRIQTGISYSGHDLLTRSLVFGISNGLAYAILEWGIFKKFPTQTNSQLWIRIVLEVLAGAHVTYFWFNYFWNWTETHFDSYLLLVFEYFSMVFVPMALAYGLGFLWKRDSSSASLLLFQSENGKDKIQIQPSHFYFLKSAGNYVEVWTKTGEKLKTDLIRNSLKAFEEKNDYEGLLLRCHRSYLVNPKQVVRVIRAKGKTELDLGITTIPVSSQYEENFLN